MKWKNILIGLSVVVFFSLLHVMGVFGRIGNQLFDFFLGFRTGRERLSDVVFLDVDDNAIAYNGVFPWPRSVTADGLLRLKEYGARAAIFDIEFIDKGPQGVDTIYLDQRLPGDFDRSFSEINSASSDILSALKSARIDPADIDEYARALTNIISSERHSLFSKAQGIARDNDQYLIEASALYGESWVTLNLREAPLSGEQAERRPLAEEHFSHPVHALPDANNGKFIDILPPLPGFAMSAKGAGFTNVEIDKDGIRRRIDLAQNIYNHWYLQLALAPLIKYLGNPEIELSARKMIIKDAEMPNGITKDIVIPLDGEGRMILDWPKEDYISSFRHISFVDFSLLEEIEAELEKYARAFIEVEIPFFAQFDSSLARLPIITGEISELLDAAHEMKSRALEDCSDDYFGLYMDYRKQSHDLLREFLNVRPGEKISALLPDLTELHPENADIILDEAGYIAALEDAIRVDLDKYEELSGFIRNEVNGKFCILGRVDTGTTDIGANPFYNEYVNVGTHGVVLDMILSETFIRYIEIKWQILFAILWVTLFFIASSKLSPVPRVVSGFLTTGVLIFISIWVFRYTGIFFSPLLAAVSMIGAVIMREIISYAGSEREKQFIRKAFSTYVSNDVVKEIIANPSRLQLGGTKRYMSAIFTDLQGFSSISENLDAEHLVSLLNRYLTAMSDVILNERGTIDKYEGDAIIAFFGAPMDLADHAMRACLAAIQMKRIERELNKLLLEEKVTPKPLLTRIGINTGDMVAGNMGTANKMDYTIMGNAVNLAARLEGVNKQYGTWILASEETVQQTGTRLLTRRLDKIRVLGIREPVRLYEVLETMEYASPEQKKLVTIFHKAVSRYENRRWKEAMEGFKEIYSIERKGPALVYLKRCNAFLVNPPKDDWDGVFNLTEK